MKIRTEQLPTGEWAAIDDDTYDAESDSVGSWSTSPVGYGSTEAAAVLELRELMADEDDGQPSEMQEWSDYDRDC